ncbi:MAG: hypothetical protein H0U76_09040 [Ktedonobacteraceae bacterium]|nr:hypothetical protein [Ktedonobacteraceae bacterium]
MFGSNVLEVVVSVIFVYILLSLLCSTINEQVIVRLLSLRAKVLEEGIVNMLRDPALVEQLYNHPLIKALSHDMSYSNLFGSQLSQPQTSSTSPSLAPVGPATIQKPSYIPADIFALALKDVLQQQREAGSPINVVIPVGVHVTFGQGNVDLEKDLVGIEAWFNSVMDRVSGWYKRRVQIFIFVLGLLIAVGLNIDTLSLITTVSHNETVRATLVSAAQGYTTQHDPNLSLLQSDISQIQPMVGWYSLPINFQDWLLKIIGLLTTTFAVSLGAPFWFDVLNKFVSFRSSGLAPSSSPDSSLLTLPSPLVMAKNDVPTTPMPQQEGV